LFFAFIAFFFLYLILFRFLFVKKGIA